MSRRSPTGAQSDAVLCVEKSDGSLHLSSSRAPLVSAVSATFLPTASRANPRTRLRLETRIPMIVHANALPRSMPPRRTRRGVGRRFVYILRSESDPERHYVGVASDVEEHLAWHNVGPTGYTLQYRPWRVIVTIEFPNETSAHPVREVPEIRLRPSLCQAALRHIGPVSLSSSGATERSRSSMT